MSQHAGKCRNKNNKKDCITNLVIATSKKESLTSRKSSRQEKNGIKKNQTTAQKNMQRKTHNVCMQHRSKPGQWDLASKMQK